VEWWWDFGDGTVSTERSPRKVFRASGTYTVRLTATDDRDATGTASRRMSVSTSPCGPDPTPAIPTLRNGTFAKATSAARGQWRVFKICVPSGRSRIVTTLDGTAGDLNLYVRRAARPTTKTYTCRGITTRPDETCSIRRPANAWHYVGVITYRGSKGSTFRVRATY
jgi:PKD repeat protein